MTTGLTFHENFPPKKNKRAKSDFIVFLVVVAL